MIVEQISQLDPAEQELLLRAPALVTLFVASADHVIDKKETSFSIKLVDYRTFTSDEKLQPYYELCSERFEDDLAHMLDTWDNTRSRGEVEAELHKLDEILPKLEHIYALHLKESWQSLARKVAEASGGFLGMGSISGVEAKAIKLSMITFS